MKKVIILWAIAMLVACALMLLKCTKTEKAPVKNPTEERSRMGGEPEPGDWYQQTGNPPPPPQQPPD